MKKAPAPKIHVPFDQRPLCEVEGCCNTAQLQSNSKATGLPIWRKVDGKYMCGTHHSERIAAKRGMKSMAHVIAANAGYDKVMDYMNSRAQEKGFANYTEYSNSKHPYLKYRKDYCENTDGRLGFTCTTTIFWNGMLDVDHIDGNSENNDESNLQTLCKCCHSYKGWVNKDYETPGRKTIRKSKLLSTLA